MFFDFLSRTVFVSKELVTPTFVKPGDNGAEDRRTMTLFQFFFLDYFWPGSLQKQAGQPLIPLFLFNGHLTTSIYRKIRRKPFSSEAIQSTDLDIGMSSRRRHALLRQQLLRALVWVVIAHGDG